jgi:hypothetical protein
MCEFADGPKFEEILQTPAFECNRMRLLTTRKRSYDR